MLYDGDDVLLVKVHGVPVGGGFKASDYLVGPPGAVKVVYGLGQPFCARLSARCGCKAVRSALVPMVGIRVGR